MRTYAATTACLLFVGALSPRAAAQKPDGSERGTPALELLGQLWKGEMAEAIDPSTVLTVDLANTPKASALLEELLHFGKPSLGEETSADAAALAQARWRFLSLTRNERSERLDALAARRKAGAERAQGQAARQAKVERYRTEARQIDALVRGDLDVRVDPLPLLRLDLSDPLVVDVTRTLLGLSLEPRQARTLDFPEQASARRSPEPYVPPPFDPWARLTLSIEEQRRPRGQPDEEGLAPGPDPAIRRSIEALGAVRMRRDAVDTALAPPPPEEPQAETPPPREQVPPDPVREAVTLRTRALLAFLSRLPSERSAILDQHTRRQEAARAAPAGESDEARQAVQAAELKVAERDAEQAAAKAKKQASAAEEAAEAARKERAEAVTAAEAARGAAEKAAARERIALLGVKEQQSRYEADLAGQRTGLHEERARILERVQKAMTTAQAITRSDDRDSSADSLWPEIRELLLRERKGLADGLRMLGADSSVPSPADVPIENEAPEGDRATLGALRSGLRNSLETLTDLEAEVRWEMVETRAASVQDLNHARLVLIPVMTSGLRDNLVGFNADGFEQLFGEVEHAIVMGRYRLAAAPRALSRGLDQLKRSPLSFLAFLLYLAGVVLAFRWWRANGGRVVQQIQEKRAKARARDRLARLGDDALWYYLRVREPLEWLILLMLIAWLAGSVAELTEVQLLVLGAKWLLIGGLSIRLIDGIASRHQAFSREVSDTAELRYRSLRLVGLTVVVVGLVLGITETLVGRGTLYAWVLGTFWMVSVPILFQLLRWWRSPIFQRVAARRKHNRLLRWAMAQRERRFVGSIAAAGAGAFLFAEGLYQWTMLKLSAFATVRRAHAYLFRREVAKQSRIQESTGQQVPLETATRDRLRGPHASEGGLLPVHEPALASLREALARGRSRVAIVGERGIGKSALLSRLLEAHTEDTIRVQCPPGGYDTLLAELARELGLASGDEVEIATALASRGTGLVCVDDVHRLIRPAIRGLADFDRLLALIRSVSSEASWVITSGPEAWRLVSMARGTRPLFDETLVLRPWREEHIGALLVRRSGAIGLSPSFEGLKVPSQLGADESVDDAVAAEHAYHRLLWDYGDGNPQVALWFWAESLFRTDGQVVVRLFDMPQAAEIEGLPIELHFILRALAQMELATSADLERCTGLGGERVADALRHLHGLGCIEIDTGGWWRLHDHWYRTVIRVLIRQHLLAQQGGLA